MEAYVLNKVASVCLEIRSGRILGDGLVEVCIFNEVLPVRKHEFDELGKVGVLFRQQVNQLKMLMEK